jgi:metallopeptidase MepB
MLENWCWTPSQLKFLSRHYSDLSPEYLATWKESTGASASDPPDPTLPDDMIDTLIKTKHVNEGIANLRQLHFGTFDMTVHEPESHEALEAMDFTVLYNQLRPKITLVSGPDSLGMGFKYGNGQATFGHLMGGYDAGYYGYLSSQVYSMDMFYSVFAKDPMNAEEGRRYRHAVLEKGGSQDEMETLKGFLGREPKPDAFYKELGIGE